MVEKSRRSEHSAKNESEYATFEDALKKVLSVPRLQNAGYARMGEETEEGFFPRFPGEKN